MAKKNLSVPEVARLCGLRDSTVRSIISRKNKTIALEVAFKLAKGLNVSIEELNGEKFISYKTDESLEKERGEGDLPGTFKERLVKAMQIRDMSQSDLVKATGLSKPRISQYVNGTYEAKQKALYAIAKALNINISWLMGNDVPMEIDYEKLDQEASACELLQKIYGKEALAFIRLYLKLDKKSREKISEIASLYLKLDDYDKGSVAERIKVLLEQEKYSAKEESNYA